MPKPSSNKSHKALTKKTSSKKAARPDTRQQLTLAQAKQLTEQYPQELRGWKALAVNLLEAGQFEEALEATDQASTLAPHDHEIYELLAQAENKLGNSSKAMDLLKKALELKPDYIQGHYHLAKILFDRAQNKEALEHIDHADRLLPNNNDVLSQKGNILNRLYRYDEAITIFEKLAKRQPEHYSHWNNAGNLKRDIGLLDEADIYYRKSIELVGASSALPYSNRLALLHYHPGYSREEIFEVCKEWDTRFTQSVKTTRPQPTDKTLQRRIRIGMFSDGFRNHPVGRMIVKVLENLKKHEIEIYAYSTNNAVDPLTARIRATASQWLPIQHLSDEAFAQHIRDDEIDILIDLCGHNTGSRMRVMAQEPAPVLVKWVGGLINTTGLKAIDYLISDGIESPQGDDEFYTEKLIRMPDDYICYSFPDKSPDVQPLPALSNAYITLGCFNNPTKVNDVLLAEWAELMHSLPASRLFLKGHQYNSPKLCDRIRATMASHGINSERLIIEGPSRHFELLEAYNRVDIALDPWPYSGGLTTCEAMLMGVPVVTLPGPTFAGRHSATHLTNAGMPELVTNSWDEYRQRVIGLASDLQSLSTIRTHLRDILQQSPVCDGPRFAKHFTIAMRAIWQRYCEGKAPAALALTKDETAQFEGEEHPVEILHSEPLVDERSEFGWQFQGKITVIDNGAGLTSSSEATKLLKLGAFSMISFDPASRIINVGQLQAAGELHHYPHTVIGDGKPATLHACLDPTMSATLRPLSSIKTLTGEEEGPKVLAKLPVNTIQLDKIEGLESIDWLILDNMNDSLAVLESGEKALTNTLLIQASVNFQPTHEQQPELTLISHWAARHGFSFYRLNDPTHFSHLPKRDDLVRHQATQLMCADAIYIPNAARMEKLTSNQLMKLAFILHTKYKLHDLSYKIIRICNKKLAQKYLYVYKYLESSKELSFISEEKAQSLSTQKGKKRFIHICFNNMHTQSLVSIFSNEDVADNFLHYIFIDRDQSIPGYNVDIRESSTAFFFEWRKQLSDVLEECLKKEVIGVFIHGLFFEWQKKLISQIGNNKKILWVIWGGDLFNPIKTKKPLHALIENIDAVATVTESDYNIFENFYGPKPAYKFRYNSEFEEINISLETPKTKTIIVGNSGDPSNNHIEILNALSEKKDIFDYRIIIPFSYNHNKPYEEAVRKKLKDLHLDESTTMLTKHLERREYFQLIGESELLITAHHRSQAGATINAGIYYGTKIILRKEICFEGKWISNPHWERIAAIGVSPIDYSEFLKFAKLSKLPVKSSKEIAREQELVTLHRGADATKQQIKKTVTDFFEAHTGRGNN